MLLCQVRLARSVVWWNSYKSIFFRDQSRVFISSTILFIMSELERKLWSRHTRNGSAVNVTSSHFKSILSCQWDVNLFINSWDWKKEKIIIIYLAEAGFIEYFYYNIQWFITFILVFSFGSSIRLARGKSWALTAFMLIFVSSITMESSSQWGSESEL